MHLSTLIKGSSVFDFSSQVDESSVATLRQWLMKQCQAGTKKVVIMLSTVGGNAYEAFGAYDTIQALAASGMEIRIVATGRCMSAGTLIITAVEQKFRHATPNARLLTHCVGITTDDQRIECPVSSNPELARAVQDYTGMPIVEACALQDRLIELLVAGTHLSREEVFVLLRKESYFWPDKALEYGLIGSILDPNDVAPSSKKRPWYKWRR